MRIYHYTSIESLALILHNKTIRFSRLDTVDDPDEFSFVRSGHNPAKFTYVSCWTSNDRENIPQWVMYGNGRHGVRVAFDADMFDWKQERTYLQWFSDENFVKFDFMTMPILHPERQPSDIQYVDNPQSYIDNIFVNVDGVDAINFNNVALYKSKDWEFQKECRYILHAIPKKANGTFWDLAAYIEKNLYCKQTYIDVPIKRQALMQMQILLGPDVTAAEQTIVEALCQTYLNCKPITKSAFTL